MTTTITVPSGHGNTSVSLTYATAASASLATHLLASVYAYAAAGTLGPSDEFVITKAGAYTVPAGVQFIVDSAHGSVTLTGNGDPVIAVGSGTLDYMSPGGSGTVIAGAGTDSFTGSNYALLGDATTAAVLSGSDTVTAGTDTLTGASASVTAVGTGAFVYGSGPGTSDTITDAHKGLNTFYIDAGATTVNALSAGGLYYDMSGSLYFLNSGASTVVGTATSGSATLYGGSAALTFMQDSDTSPVTFFGGKGSATLVSGAAGGITAYGAAGGAINLSGGAASAFNELIGGTGSETLNAATSVGTDIIEAGSAKLLAFMSDTSPDAFYAGSKNASVYGGTIQGGHSVTDLPDVYAFVNGQSGGTDTIYNFGPNSTLMFSNYGATEDAKIKEALKAAGSGTSVSFRLPDNTRITLIGINGQTIDPAKNTNLFS